MCTSICCLYGCRACARRRVASSLGVTSGRRMMQALRRDRGMCTRSAAATLAPWTSCVGGVHSCSTRSACRRRRKAEITGEVEWGHKVGGRCRCSKPSKGHLMSGRVRRFLCFLLGMEFCLTFFTSPSLVLFCAERGRGASSRAVSLPRCCLLCRRDTSMYLTRSQHAGHIAQYFHHYMTRRSGCKVS